RARAGRVPPGDPGRGAARPDPRTRATRAGDAPARHRAHRRRLSRSSKLGCPAAPWPGPPWGHGPAGGGHRIVEEPAPRGRRGRSRGRQATVKLSAMLIDELRKLPYEENVRWLADTGYQAVDPPVLEPRAGDIARSMGLEPGCASVGGGVVGTNAATAQATVRDKIMQAIPWAAGEGVSCLMVPHGRDTTISPEEQLEGFRRVYGPAADSAAQHGVYLTVENWPNNGRNLMFSPETWNVVFDAIPSD